MPKFTISKICKYYSLNESLFRKDELFQPISYFFNYRKTHFYWNTTSFHWPQYDLNMTTNLRSFNMVSNSLHLEIGPKKPKISISKLCKYFNFYSDPSAEKVNSFRLFKSFSHRKTQCFIDFNIICIRQQKSWNFRTISNIPNL